MILVVYESCEIFHMILLRSLTRYSCCRLNAGQGLPATHELELGCTFVHRKYILTFGPLIAHSPKTFRCYILYLYTRYVDKREPLGQAKS